MQIENSINNLNRIEISGIFGAGNYDLILVRTCLGSFLTYFWLN
ncbi:hypothetical protein [Spiroplasma endosymbiont of Dactylopius coccus]